jgi:hypothetical protein
MSWGSDSSAPARLLAQAGPAYASGRERAGWARAFAPRGALSGAPRGPSGEMQAIPVGTLTAHTLRKMLWGVGTTRQRFPLLALRPRRRGSSTRGACVTARASLCCCGGGGRGETDRRRRPGHARACVPLAGGGAASARCCRLRQGERRAATPRGTHATLPHETNKLASQRATAHASPAPSQRRRAALRGGVPRPPDLGRVSGVPQSVAPD